MPEGWVEWRAKLRDAMGEPTSPMAEPRASKEMLKISATNRYIATVRQAQLLILLHKHADYIFKRAKRPRCWEFLDDFWKNIETHQLTLEGMSRENFMDIEKAALRIKAKKPLLSLSPNKSGEEETEED